jgi:hypothetical protein
MNRADTTTRRATTAIVAAVALFAAGDSFTDIYDLARAYGQGMVSAALLPLAGDGLMRPCPGASAPGSCDPPVSPASAPADPSVRSSSFSKTRP